MLKVSRIDRIVLRRVLPSFDVFGKLLKELEFVSCSLPNCSPVAPCKKEHVEGRELWIKLGNRSVRIRLFKSMGFAYLDYSFGGDTDLVMLDVYTMVFGEWGFASALAHGKVARLELAFDMPGFRTSDMLTHMVGVKSSLVVENDTKDGFSYYSGRPYEAVQLIAYDKGQQMRDLGRTPIWSDYLRVELRFCDSTRSLREVYDHLLQDDPFSRLRLVRWIDACTKKTTIQNWIPFLHTCRERGVAEALQVFSKHKKTFLGYLQCLSQASFIPSINSYGGAMKNTLPASLIAPVEDC